MDIDTLFLLALMVGKIRRISISFKFRLSLSRL